MAKIFFVKDGSGDHRTSRGHPIDMQTVLLKMPGIQTRYFQTGPKINEGIASPYSPYLHVVLETLEGEKTEIFPNPGFYYLIGLSVDNAMEMLSVERIVDC